MSDRYDWYDEKTADDAAKSLFSRFLLIRSLHALRLSQIEFYHSLYAPDNDGLTESDGSLADLFESALSTQLNDNVIQRIVQSMCAKFARQRPKPTVVTDGGDWLLRQRAKKYDKWIWGCMHAARAYEEQRMSDMHMLLDGDGFLYVTRQGKRLVIEHAPTDEVFVDPLEARLGKPRSIYRERFIERRQLMKLYPKRRDNIEEAETSDTSLSGRASLSSGSQMVRVVTGWRLPSEEGAHDGRCVVSTSSGELSSGEWTRQRFPFARSKYALAPSGYYGVGIVQSLVSAQVELNRTLETRQLSLEMLSAPFWLVSSGSKVVKSYLSNVIGRVLEYTGIKPEVVTPSAVNPESFTHGDRVKSSMFQQSGLSEMAVQGMKPAGLDSGKAIRAYADMMDDSIHDCFIRREQQISDLAELILDEAEEAQEEGEELIGSVYVGPMGSERLSFKDVALDRESISMRVQPASSLSTTIAGRFEDVDYLQKLGVVTDPKKMQELLQIPDIEAFAEENLSSEELFKRILYEDILVDGNLVIPEPDWDLQLALETCMQVKVFAQIKKVPEDRIALLRAFQEKCAYWINEREMAASGGGSAVPLEPQQTPGAPMPLEGIGAQPLPGDIAGMPAGM